MTTIGSSAWACSCSTWSPPSVLSSYMPAFIIGAEEKLQWRSYALTGIACWCPLLYVFVAVGKFPWGKLLPAAWKALWGRAQVVSLGGESGGFADVPGLLGLV